jgi:hypothetical protein
MGGYGPLGAIPSISHVVPSARRTPRFVPSLPDAFPLGREGIQASMIGSSIFVCSPGAQKLVAVRTPPPVLTPFQVCVEMSWKIP